MKKTVITCDRCKKRITNDDDLGEMSATHPTAYMGTAHSCQLELCQSCYKDIFNFALGDTNANYHAMDERK